MIIALAGKSSVGKDLLCNMISKDLNIPILVSHATRQPRINEIDGKSYHFITKEQFNHMLKNNEIVESTSYKISRNKIDYYGLSTCEIEKYPISLVILNTDGINQILNSKYANQLITILIECDDKTRFMRYLSRDNNSTVEECINRYYIDKQDFDNPDFTTDYIVTNDTILEKAFMDLKKIVNEIITETLSGDYI